jgi:hypothetical protein
MNDAVQQSPIHPLHPQQQGAVGAAKESEPFVENANTETPTVSEIGADVELSPEVSAAGVSVRPTVVHIPQPLEAHGIRPAGQNVQLGTGETIELPLSEDEIAAGLKQNPLSSWRFLALWCKRQLTIVGHAIQTIGGKSAGDST